MSTQLFQTKGHPQFLLNIVFDGPSFKGMMEIDALAKEIQGLEDVLKIALHSLKKNRKIDIKVSDLEIYVEAFEKGSFRKKIKVFNKATKEYQPLIELAVLVVLVFQTIPQYRAEDIKTISPELVSAIRNEVVLELIQDKKFLNAAANVVKSVSLEGDMCTLSSPTKQEVVINQESSKKFVALTDQSDEQVDDGEHYEILMVKVNRVDLDALKRHIGFKVNSEGSTVDGTFVEKPSREEMRSLLDEWMEVKGTASYFGGQRNHIDIQEYKTISQPRLFDEDENEN